MAVGGTWKLSMHTPLGERHATLLLETDSGGLTGTLTNEEGRSTTIFDCHLNGNSAGWKAAIKNPMPLTLEFTATIDGDKISGMVSAGGVGSWDFAGTRG